MRDILIAGNWKMNGSTESNKALIQAIIMQCEFSPHVELLVLPPSIYLHQVRQLIRETPIKLGCQQINQHASGAFTGEIAPSMIKEFQCSHSLIGHSERRHLFQETEQDTAEKFAVLINHTISPILCIGETLVQYQQSQTQDVLIHQLKTVIDHVGIEAFQSAVIAYEPVWAIGTGKSADSDEVESTHQIIREFLTSYDPTIADKIQVLYGGSVNASNAAAFLACENIDGLLIGGASLDGETFASIHQLAINCFSH